MEFTPVFRFSYPSRGEPMRLGRLHLQANAEAMEAALVELAAQRVDPYSPFGRALLSALTTVIADEDVVEAAAAEAVADAVAELGAVTYDPADLGYDVVLLLGQSNMAGRGTPFDQRTDPPDPRVYAYSATGTYAGQIVQAVETLAHHEGAAAGVGPGLPFARWYADTIPTTRRVLLVPAARGGTGFEASTTVYRWKVGHTPASDSLFEAAVAQAQGALAAAGPGSRLVAALWVQGETDGDNNVPAATYEADLDQLVATLRSRLAAPDLPFVIGGMVPEYLGTGTRRAIDGVHSSTPFRLPRTAYVAGPTNAHKGDGNHYNAAGARSMGRAMVDGLRRATSDAEDLLQTIGLQADRAYSAGRRLHTAAAVAMTVRRSSDNATLDVGFTSAGLLDTAALGAFAGAGDVFVTKLWDQSGRGRHLAQTTAAAQPRIVTAGQVVLSGGRPALLFDGVDDVLWVASATLGAARGSTVATVHAAPRPGISRWWAEALAAGNNQWSMHQPDNASTLHGSAVYSVFTGTDGTTYGVPVGAHTGSHPLFDGAIHQASGVDTGTAFAQWVDGAVDLAPSPFTRPASEPPRDRFAIGGVVRSGSLAPVPNLRFSEFIGWASVLPDALRQGVELSQRSYFATPVGV